MNMKDKGCIFSIQKFSIHDGPGIRTVIFFKGCPLRCRWCSNPESQNGRPEDIWDPQRRKQTSVGEYKSVPEILKEVMKDEAFYLESDGGVTLSGGEVLYQPDFALALLKALKEQNLHVACETTGFAKPDVFKNFIQNIDLLFFDVKHYDTAKHQKGTGVSNELILKNLQTAQASQTDLTVRIPVIPGYNDSLEDAQCFSDLFNDFGIFSVELLPFHQFGEEKYKNLGKSYELSDTPQLHTEDLEDYSRVMEQNGISCMVR